MNKWSGKMGARKGSYKFSFTEPYIDAGVRHKKAKFVTISRTFGQRKLLQKHQLKVYYRASFTQNFKSLSIKMEELGLEPQCARVVRHLDTEFVKVVLELIAQEPLVTENTCKAIY